MVVDEIDSQCFEKEKWITFLKGINSGHEFHFREMQKKEKERKKPDFVIHVKLKH